MDNNELLFFLARWIHVFFGILWIGLLYYFNFVQVPAMPAIPAEQKPAITQHIAPKALFYFRWAAMFTLLFGLVLMLHRGDAHDALTLGLMDGGPTAMNTILIGFGMWAGIIMWFNVWFVIWPKQKIVLGMVEADADAKAKAARKAMLFSRTNTLLSFTMLIGMEGASHYPG